MCDITHSLEYILNDYYSTLKHSPFVKRNKKKREMYFPIHFVIMFVCLSERALAVLKKMLRENKVTLQQKCLSHLLRVIFDIFLALFLCISF